MSEATSVAESPTPSTRASLAADLRALGLAPGMTALMHSSLSSLGWVCGGSVAVVQALLDVLTPEGTLVAPTHSGDLTDPAQWRNPPVPQEWWPIIYETMPAFDPQITPTRGMGRIVETFRAWPGAVRSNHPTSSFAAWGRHATEITANHSLDNALGERSPLARVYDLGGYVLLLGVGFGNNTSFHLAEYRTPAPPPDVQGSPIFEHRQRVWKWYADIVLDADPFPELGAAFERTGAVAIGRVGLAEARLFPQRPAVDFATAWLTARQKSSG